MTPISLKLSGKRKIAYSALFRTPVPGEAGHRFRLIPATHSGGSRPPIPDDSGHPNEIHIKRLLQF